MQTGGALLTLRDFLSAVRRHDPRAFEEMFEELVLAALEEHDQMIVDDLQLLTAVMDSHDNYFYPRKGLLNAPLTPLATYAAEAGKRLVFGAARDLPDPVRERCHHAAVGDFEPEDYQALAAAYLGEGAAAAVDWQRVHRFARELNAHQIKASCQYLRADGVPLDAERFVDYLRANRLSSNVDLGEVQAVGLHHLCGVEDVVRSLEANIIVPLEDDALANELGLRPKRGVLLAGPPGTGKTTVGRALAHRLKSKFFLLDRRQKPDEGAYDEASYAEARRDDPADRWLFEAFDAAPSWEDGVYEALGPKIQGDPEKYGRHTLVRVVPFEPWLVLADVPRDFDGLRAFLAARDIEGVVIHHPDGRKAKIKKHDFGLRR